ncbi:protein NRT1/ PTR FAMILY 5.5-like [Salvia miltiorrhiza]|uniref:protein NRT1/ PTR FAMILY 5.5-like n=1 Tax=Salvia miltiorrhiza TaxID=226208 RepID=UPI0025ACCCB2|nr:protein NRT1/ PTR FAMILY 5.5-like [Salvia miltiorrhiza]
MINNEGIRFRIEKEEVKNERILQSWIFFSLQSLFPSLSFSYKVIQQSLSLFLVDFQQRLIPKMQSFVRISALLWADILVAYAFFEMQDYLTTVWKLSYTHAAGILNVWNGISMILPVFFLVVVDTLLGNFKMLLVSSIAYTVGIGLVTMSTPPVLAKSTRSCKGYAPECIGHTQKILFYTGMALIAVGIAGNLVSLKTYLAEQKAEKPDEDDDKENIPRCAELDPLRFCCQIPGAVMVVVVPIVGAIALPYIKPWKLRFGIPAICTVLATVFFPTGWPCYRKVRPKGSPVTNVCRVFVAAAFKLFQPFPLSDEQYYKIEGEQVADFSPTCLLRWLHKAAIILPGDLSEEKRVTNTWRLCSVAQVEDAKIAVRMVPMWMTFVVCGMVSSTGNTYFVEQAKNMNRKLGKLKLPPQILLLAQRSANKVFGWWKEALLADRWKGTPAIGIGVAMISSVLCCVAAAVVETERLKVIRKHGFLDKPDENIPMNILWLIFQFILLAGLDSFMENSVAAFYNDQSPRSMKNDSTRRYIKQFIKGVSGLGFMCSVLSVYVVGKVSERGGKTTSWFQFTLNKSRLDRYFWVLAVLSSLNLAVFILVALHYKYQKQDESEQDEAGADMSSGGNLL